MSRDPRRGAALLIVLVFSALLAGFAATALRTGLSGARAAAVFADAVRADELARGATAALAYRVATGDAAAKRGGAIGLRLPDADITIDYVSESARADANTASVPLLAALLGAAGAEPAEVEAITARIARFRKDAAERGKPAASGTAAPALGGLAALRASVDALGPAAAQPQNAGPAAIRDLSEVAADWGLSGALARTLLPALTVSGDARTVDPVLAGRLVLAALLGGDERVDDYMRRRRDGFESRDSALALIPVPARDFVSFSDAPAVRAVARVRVAKRYERRYEFVLAPPARGQGAPPSPGSDAGGGAALPVVVSWRVLP